MNKATANLTKAESTTSARQTPSHRVLPQRNPIEPRAAISRALGHSSPVQTKLRVSQPGDAQEVEADRVADAVMREPSGKVPSSFPSVAATGNQAARKCQDCEDEQVQRKAKKTSPEEEEQIVHTKSRNDTEGGPQLDDAQLPSLGQLSGGHPIPDIDRQFVENRFGRDFSDVRIHIDGNMTEQLSARAFTAGKNLVFAPGEYQAGQDKSRRLLAHELAHVVQQEKAPPAKVQRKANNKPSAPASAKAEEIAPETVDIIGQSSLTLSETNQKWFNGGEGEDVKLRIKMGNLAEGVVDVTYKNKTISLPKIQAIELKHPLFQKIAAHVPGLEPQLILKKDLTGHVGLNKKDSKPSENDSKKVFSHLLPPGFDPASSCTSKVVNKLEKGILEIGLQEWDLNYGSLFSGKLNLISKNGATVFNCSLTTSVKGLKEGSLILQRDEQGIFSGEASLDTQLTKEISGKVKLRYDGNKADGEGMISYQGEKFSGQVQLKVLPEQKAAELEASKKAPEGSDKPTAPTPGVSNNQMGDFVVFGDGELDFAFTDWLMGKAQVIITPTGDLTVIGEIKPQAEVLLFPATPWDKSLAKIEARATYGLPVVGNVFIGASLEPGAFATFGEGKIHQIEILGTYSTKPDEADDFSIQATLNINAAAGGKLRGSVFAGLEILDHELKAGGAITGLIGIQGYLDATPVIGYREKVSESGQDKKGEFFIKGDAEIAAQAFVGLQGEFFLEVDSPFWSLLPDERWTWPLGGKTWPLGQSVAVGAEMEYVFGSGKAPDFKLKPAEFNADKFTTDLFEGRTSSAKDAKAHGKWNEKTPKDKAKGTQNAEVPKDNKANEKGNVEGKGVDGSGPAPKKGDAPKKASDQSKTAEGKTVAQLKREASQGDIKKKPKMKGAKSEPNPNVGAQEKEAEANKQKAAMEVDEVLKTGIRRRDLLLLLAELKSRYKLKVARIQKDDDVELVNSPSLERHADAWCGEAKADVSGTPKSQDLKGRQKKTDPEQKTGVLETKSTPEKTILGAVDQVLPKTAVKILSKKYPSMADQAERPLEAAAGLFYKSELKAHKRDSAMTKRVGQLGNIEHDIRSSSPKSNNNSKNGAPKLYHGGHLIGYDFGGTETYPNLVPQMGATINLSLYKRIENSVRQSLDTTITSDVHVYFEVRLDYGSDKSYEKPLLDAAGAVYQFEYPLQKKEGDGFHTEGELSQEAKDKAPTMENPPLSIPKRLPERTDIRIVLSGVANPELANLPASDRSNAGGTIDVNNCIIIAEGQTVKKEAVDQDNVEKKVKANAGKEVKVVSEYVINHTQP